LQVISLSKNAHKVKVSEVPASLKEQNEENIFSDKGKQLNSVVKGSTSSSQKSKLAL